MNQTYMMTITVTQAEPTAPTNSVTTTNTTTIDSTLTNSTNTTINSNSTSTNDTNSDIAADSSGIFNYSYTVDKSSGLRIKVFNQPIPSSVNPLTASI